MEDFGSGIVIAALFSSVPMLEGGYIYCCISHTDTHTQAKKQASEAFKCLSSAPKQMTKSTTTLNIRAMNGILSQILTHTYMVREGGTRGKINMNQNSNNKNKPLSYAHSHTHTHTQTISRQMADCKDIERRVCVHTTMFKQCMSLQHIESLQR